ARRLRGGAHDAGGVPLGEPHRVRALARRAQARGPVSGGSPRRRGEVDTAAAREPDRRVRSRLGALAADMRARAPDPPEGFDPETHRLLLARLDDVERWSLDDVESRLPR